VTSHSSHDPRDVHMSVPTAKLRELAQRSPLVLIVREDADEGPRVSSFAASGLAR
jgi:hypothetical protein